MAHHSRLNTLVIDVPDERFADAVAFWAAALGREPNREPAEAQPYLRLEGGDGRPGVVLQRIDEAPRYHVDIASDDVGAEVQRLVEAGATVVGAVETWVVLREPAGLFVCVIPAEGEPAAFEATSTLWE